MSGAEKGRALPPAARTTLRLILSALLLALAGQGARNVWQNLADPMTGLQQAMTAAQFGYALAALATVAALWLAPGRAMAAASAFALAFVAAVGLIPPAWVPELAADWWRWAGGAALAAAVLLLGVRVAR